MSEPLPEFKPIVTVLWIALITAIVVTVIDWKIKQDILRLTDAFYKVYPSTLESQGAQQNSESVRPDSASNVLRFSSVDHDSRMETNDVPKSPESVVEQTQPQSWIDWRGLEEQFTDSGANDDSRELQEGSVEIPRGESE